MTKINQIKEAAEADFITFITLVAPYIHLGDVHRELAAWLTRQEGKDNKLVLLPRGHMKLGRLDQKIALADGGWTTHGDVKEGDLILGGDGNPTRVLVTHPIVNVPLFEVEMKDGRKFICNDDHLFEVECPSNWGKGIYKVLPLKEIIKNYKSDRLDKRNNKTFTERRYFIRQSPAANYSEKKLPISPYILGVWLGDGTSVDTTITIGKQDLEHFVNEFNNELLPFRKPVKDYRKDVYLCRFGEKVGKYNTAKSTLKSLGVLKNKHIPDIYLEGSIQQRLALLQGLMDSDGTASKCNNTASFTNKDERLIDQFIHLVRGLGGKAVKSSNIVKDTKYYIVNIWLPKYKTFRLKRKQDLLKNIDSVKTSIWNIKQIENGLGRCITVENEDGLYITNDYLLTHNSKMVAFLAAWWITREPTETILYVSATADLAEKQLYQIKQILESPIHRRYWPDMIHPDEGKRERWTVAEIIVDAPSRKLEGTRDPTVKAIGITGNTTGFHATKVILDDLVVPGNAYTEDGRGKVAQLYSQLASIEEPNAQEVVVGTRYHPQDLYNTLLTMKEIVFTPDGEEEDEVYEIFQRVVETDGEYLWPRSQRKDGKAFGFDDQVLARIKAKYVDQAQFYAQYYNEPNAAGDRAIDSAKFQYFDKKHLREEDGYWFFKDKRLALSAAIDFAFSLKRKADSTAIVVVGTDHENNHYVLDILRFKTEKISEYFKNILEMHHKWNVKKWRAEITVAQQAIVRELKDNYIKPQGINISIDEYRPSRHEGDKEERIEAILSHRYENMQIWHYRGGNTQLLEEELVLRRPPHDDIKEALANAIAISIPGKRTYAHSTNVIQFKSRFGGI